MNVNRGPPRPLERGSRCSYKEVHTLLTVDDQGVSLRNNVGSLISWDKWSRTRITWRWLPCCFTAGEILSVLYFCVHRKKPVLFFSIFTKAGRVEDSVRVDTRGIRHLFLNNQKLGGHLVELCAASNRVYMYCMLASCIWHLPLQKTQIIL